MLKLILFNQLEKIDYKENDGDHLLNQSRIFNQWIAQTRIFSCDLDEPAVQFSNNYSREEFQCLKQLKSELCDARELLKRDVVDHATVIESSICGDFFVQLEIVYWAIKKNVPFVFLDKSTLIDRSSLFNKGWNKWATEVHSHIADQYTDGAKLKRTKHVSAMMKKLPKKKTNQKNMLLISVTKLWPTWFEPKVRATTTDAMMEIVTEMAAEILRAQNSLTIVCRPKKNATGNEALCYEASLSVDINKCSYIEPRKKIEIRLDKLSESLAKVSYITILCFGYNYSSLCNFRKSRPSSFKKYFEKTGKPCYQKY